MEISTGASLKGMSSILLCWFTMPEADIVCVVRQQRLNLLASIPLLFVAVWQMAAEGPSNKMASHMEVRMECRYGKDFLHAEKTAPIEIHPCLLNIYGD